MFRHILVPTDGSPLSDLAIKRAVSLAKAGQTQLTFFYAAPDESSSILDDGELVRSIDPQLMASTINKHLHQVLDKAQDVADAEGVPCQVLSAVSDDPFEAIIAASEEKGCDLILMASHGFRGIKGLLLGSQTQKVLTHSRIPVLVYR